MPTRNRMKSLLPKEAISESIPWLPAELPPLPPIPLEYTDFAHWQERLLAGPYGERLWEFWRRELAPPLPRLELPADRPRPAAPRNIAP